MTKRLNFSDKFKAAVVLEALRGDKTVQEIGASASSTRRRRVHGNGRLLKAWLASSQASYVHEITGVPSKTDHQ